MSKHSCRLLGLIIVFVLIDVAPGLAKRGPRAIKANVHFLAESTFVRNTFGWNSDTYLAEISGIATNESELVRIVDDYPNWSAPLAHEQLIAEAGSTLKVYRDTECDLPYAQVLLRAAPGDPIAILSERLVYQPQFAKAIAPQTHLPCYRVSRR